MGKSNLLVAGVLLAVAGAQAFLNYQQDKESEKILKARRAKQNEAAAKQMADLNEMIFHTEKITEFIELLKAKVQSSGLPITIWTLGKLDGAGSKHVIIWNKKPEFEKVLDDGKVRSKLIGPNTTITVKLGFGINSLNLSWDRQNIALEKVVNMVIGESEKKYRDFKVLSPIPKL